MIFFFLLFILVKSFLYCSLFVCLTWQRNPECSESSLLCFRLSHLSWCLLLLHGTHFWKWRICRGALITQRPEEAGSVCFGYHTIKLLGNFEALIESQQRQLKSKARKAFNTLTRQRDWQSSKERATVKYSSSFVLSQVRVKGFGCYSNAHLLITHCSMLLILTY